MILKQGQSHSLGALAADTAIIAVKGVVSWSTDGGTTKDNIYGPEHDPLNNRGRIIISAGNTVTLYNDRSKDCEAIWMAV